MGKWASPPFVGRYGNFLSFVYKMKQSRDMNPLPHCTSVRSLSIATIRHRNPSRDSPGLITSLKTAGLSCRPYVGKATSSPACCLCSSPHALCGLARSWVPQRRQSSSVPGLSEPSSVSQPDRNELKAVTCQTKHCKSKDM